MSSTDHGKKKTKKKFTGHFILYTKKDTYLLYWKTVDMTTTTNLKRYNSLDVPSFLFSSIPHTYKTIN